MALTDKRTIGLTLENRAIVEKLMNDYYFKEQIHVAKFALSVAIKNEVPVNYSFDGTDTIWNVGSFDSDGEIKSLVLALYPGTETPYRLVEYLYNKGLAIINEKIESVDDFNIFDLIE